MSNKAKKTQNDEDILKNEEQKDADVEIVPLTDEEKEAVMSETDATKISIAHLPEFNQDELLAIFNKFTDKPAKKFASHKEAILRTRNLIARFIERAGGELPEDIFIWCKDTERNIPMGGCTRRQADGSCISITCEHLKQKKGKGRKKSGGASAAAPRDTKANRIRKAFEEKPSYTAVELCEISGFDDRNLRTYLAILKNPKRMKTERMLVTVYNKETKTFSLASAATPAKPENTPETEPETAEK